MNYIDNKPLYEFNNALLSNANALDFDKFKKVLFDWEKFILINQILINLKTNKSPWQALQEFRDTTDLEALDIDTSIFEKDRSEIKEREIDL